MQGISKAKDWPSRSWNGYTKKVADMEYRPNKRIFTAMQGRFSSGLDVNLGRDISGRVQNRRGEEHRTS